MPHQPITPISHPVRASMRPPGSKSLTNRALVCAALADGTSTLTGALDSQDTCVMLDGLGQLGIDVLRQDEGRTLVVHGAQGKIPAIEADLFCANSGTTIRFLTAMSTLGHGAFRLDGVPRMRARPIGDLLEALSQLGATARSEQGEGYPPVVVHANGLPGGRAIVRGDISSQFLSGLLLSAAGARQPVRLEIDGPLVSRPYIAMTLAVLEAFGVEVVVNDDFTEFQIPAPQTYQARAYAIEPDASAASYFWATAAITGGEVTVEGLSRASLQGDVGFVDCLAQMGCEVVAADDRLTVRGGSLRGIDIDMNAISDTAQTLAVVALFAEGPTRIRGIAHNRRKETDRIGDLATELRKLGADVQENPDGFTIQPRPIQPATLATYDDHRMAMSLALVGLKVPGIVIENPQCTEKTYPHFFQDLARL